MEGKTSELNLLSDDESKLSEDQLNIEGLSIDETQSEKEKTQSEKEENESWTVTTRRSSRSPEGTLRKSHRKWCDLGSIKLRDAKKIIPDWNKYRYRISASNAGSVLGLDKRCTLSDVAKRIKRITTVKQNAAMKYGIETEPEARNYFENEMREKLKKEGDPNWDKFVVKKCDGILLSMFDPRLSCIPDGIVGEDSIIEIKCTEKMYYSLLQYKARLDKDEDSFDPTDHSHIIDMHYAQIQMELAIMNRKKCYYIVYCKLDNKAFIQPILRDHDYWTDFAYPKICSFYDTYLVC